MSGSEFSDALGALAAGIREVTTSDEFTAQLPPLINLALSEGMSGRSILTSFRAAGISIADRSVYQMIRDVEGGRINATLIGGLDYGEIPPEESFATWETSHATGYLYRFNAIFSRTDPETGEVESVLKQWAYKSSTRLALGDVIQDVTEIIMNSPIFESDPSLEFTGLTLANMYHLEP